MAQFVLGRLDSVTIMTDGEEIPALPLDGSAKGRVLSVLENVFR
jgi:hypothetical protein